MEKMLLAMKEKQAVNRNLLLRNLQHKVYYIEETIDY
jgi:hypothetical protein